MPWSKPEFVVFDKQVRPSIQPNNLSYDGYSRLVFTTGDGLHLIQNNHLSAETKKNVHNADVTIFPMQHKKLEVSTSGRSRKKGKFGRWMSKMIGDKESKDARKEKENTEEESSIHAKEQDQNGSASNGETSAAPWASLPSSSTSTSTSADPKSKYTGISSQDMQRSSSTNATNTPGGGESSPQGLHLQDLSKAERTRDITAVTWIKDIQSLYSSRKPLGSPWLAFTLEASEDSPSHIAVLYIEEQKFDVAWSYAFTNVALTGGKQVLCPMSLSCLSTMATGTILFVGTDTGHVCGFSLLDEERMVFESSITLNASSRLEQKQDREENSSTRGYAITSVCCDLLSVPFVAACDETGRVIVWEISRNNRGIIESEVIFTFEPRFDGHDACTVLQMRGGILLCGRQSGVVSFYDVTGPRNATAAHIGDLQTNARTITSMDVHRTRDWVAVAGEDCRVSIIRYPRLRIEKPFTLFSVCVNSPIPGVIFTEYTDFDPSFALLLYELPYVPIYRYQDKLDAEDLVDEANGENADVD